MAARVVLGCARRRLDQHLPALTGCEAGLLRELGEQVDSVIGGTGPEDRGHAHDRHARSLQLGKTGEELVDAPRRTPGRDADLGGVAVALLGSYLQLGDVAGQLADRRPRDGDPAVPGAHDAVEGRPAATDPDGRVRLL